ncbi:hypothetical protein QQ045_026112 [Rhodiola kirilowii]
MEGRDAMLRRLMAELHDQLIHYQHPYHDHHHHPSHSSQLVLLQHPPQISSRNFINLDASSSNGGCYNPFVMPDRSESFKMLDPCHPPTAKKFRRIACGPAYCSQMMDEVIWKEFPDDLFEGVLARLPVASFFRFRSVCRKWNSLLTSNSFSQQCDELEPSQPWLYTIINGNDRPTLYDPCSKKWHHLAPPQPVDWFPAASAGGLVCFLDISRRNFQVLNPLTHSCKKLPARSASVSSQITIGMTSNGKSSNEGYKILWLSSAGKYEVYDSERRSWSYRVSIDLSIRRPLCLNFKSRTISIGDTIYFLRSRPHGLVSYDMASGAWQQSIIPAPPYLAVMECSLAECRGRIMLVGVLRKNAVTCVCVWELQKMTLLWKEVDRMPNIWCLEFYSKPMRMSCLSNKGVLLLSLKSRQTSMQVMYNLMSREWTKDPCGHGEQQHCITSATSFHPRPTALV